MAGRAQASRARAALLRPLRAPLGARPGHERRRVQGARSQARSSGGDEDPPPGAGFPGRVGHQPQAALSSRSGGGGPAHTSSDRRRSRRWRGRRPAVHGHGVHRGRHARRPHARRPAPCPGRRGGDRRTGLCGARLRPPPRRRSSGHQASKHPRRARCHEGHGLRHGPHRGRESHADRHDAGDAGLHVARDGARPGRRPAERPVLRRCRALRNPHRGRSIQRRRSRRCALSYRQPRAAVRPPPRRRASVRSGPRTAARAGQGAGGAIRDRDGLCQRPARGGDRPTTDVEPACRARGRARPAALETPVAPRPRHSRCGVSGGRRARNVGGPSPRSRPPADRHIGGGRHA